MKDEHFLSCHLLVSTFHSILYYMLHRRVYSGSIQYASMLPIIASKVHENAIAGHHPETKCLQFRFVNHWNQHRT